jgi:four helix bundle protein
VRTNAEFKHFLRVALGSATELDYQLLLCRDLGYLSEEVHAEMSRSVDSLKRMLTVFIQRIDQSAGGAAYSLEPTAYSEGAAPQ